MHISEHVLKIVLKISFSDVFLLYPKNVTKNFWSSSKFSQFILLYTIQTQVL